MTISSIPPTHPTRHFRYQHWTHHQKYSEVLSVVVNIVSGQRKYINVLEWRTVSAFTRGIFCCLFPELRSNEGNEHQNNTSECINSSSQGYIIFLYIILFLTCHNEPINDDKTMILRHRPRVSLARFTFYWWPHNQFFMTLQWPDNCDGIAWITIFNSLNIDLIHGDIHSQSCKNLQTVDDHSELRSLCMFRFVAKCAPVSYYTACTITFDTKLM